MEFFSGMSELSMQANTTQWKATQPFELFLGDNLFISGQRRQAMEDLELWEPDLVVLEPPCGPWSSWQALGDPVRTAQLREMHRPLWKFVRRCWNAQDHAGRLVITEQPQTAKSLDLDEMKSRPNLHRVIVHQCQHGLKDPVSQKPYHKATALDCNDEALARHLKALNPPCNLPRSEHEAIQGSIRVNGKSVTRAQCASRWTPQFCKFILKAATKTLQEKESQIGQCALHEEVSQDEFDVYCAVADVNAVEENARFEEEMRKKYKEISQEDAARRGDVSGIGARYGYIHFEGPGLLVNKATRNLIAKLHGNLCHPSNQRLSRMMAIAGFESKVCEAVKYLKCQICDRVAAPASAPKVNEKRPTVFNQLVTTDGFCVLSADSKTMYWACHFVDAFNTWSAGDLQEDPAKRISSKFAADVFSSQWVSILGAPTELMHDQGNEYVKGEFVRLCSMIGTLQSPVPLSAKWRAGLAERHGAILKLMMMKVIHELTITLGWEMRHCLHMCIAAKNRLTRVNGVAPIAELMGVDPMETFSVMSQVNTGRVQYVANQEISFNEVQRRRAQIRAGANAAFVWLDANEKLRLGLNSRSRPPRLSALHAGCQVWVWEQPSNHDRRRLQDFGPGGDQEACD